MFLLLLLLLEKLLGLPGSCWCHSMPPGGPREYWWLLERSGGCIILEGSSEQGMRVKPWGRGRGEVKVLGSMDVRCGREERHFGLQYSIRITSSSRWGLRWR